MNILFNMTSSNSHYVFGNEEEKKLKGFLNKLEILVNNVDNGSNVEALIEKLNDSKCNDFSVETFTNISMVKVSGQIDKSLSFDVLLNLNKLSNKWFVETNVDLYINGKIVGIYVLDEDYIEIIVEN